jgi:hypothetical protein
MFREYQVVKLRSCVPSIPVPLDAKGVVLIVYEDEPLAYEVEFLKRDGSSLGTFTLREADLAADDSDAPPRGPN